MYTIQNQIWREADKYHIMKSHSFQLSSLVINILNKKLQDSAIVAKTMSRSVMEAERTKNKQKMLFSFIEAYKKCLAK